MTLVEVSISLLVLVIAIGGVLGSMSSFVILGDSTRDTTLAYLEAQAVIERMQAETFERAFAIFNEDPADDPGGAGTAPGANFGIPDLDVQEADADGFVGRIRFPVAAATPASLFENAVDPDFGLPRDLNADGVVDAVDHATDYVLLPVRVRVEWRGRSGNRFIELESLLCGR